MKKILFLVAVAVAFSALQAQEKSVVGKPAVKEHRGWKEGHRDHKWEERVCDFEVTKRQKYTVLYDACIDDSQHPGERIAAEGFIGMPSPHLFNWYHHGFFSMKINNNMPFRVPLTDMSVLSSGGKAIMQMVWDAPEAVVQIKFMRLVDEDGIFTQTLWFPKENVDVKTVQFNFSCYPSCFEKDGNHFAKTKTDIKYQGRDALAIDVKQNDYVFYGDKIYDAKSGKWGVSTPCYLVIDKHRLSNGFVSISSYGVATVINAAATAREARFIFADANSGDKNKEVIDYLDKNAAALQDKLMKASFMSSELDAFNPAAERKIIDEQAAKAGEFCKGYIKTVNETYNALCNCKANVGTAESWKYERDFAANFEKYKTLVMRLKIDAMMQLE